MDDDDSENFVVIQVLNVDPKSIHIASCQERLDNDQQCMVSVQVFEQWRSAFTIAGREEVHAFIIDEPRTRDILGVIGVAESMRHKIRSWSVRKSDIDGCISLYDPKPLRPRLDVPTSPKFPIYFLVDLLAAGGWTPVLHRV